MAKKLLLAEDSLTIQKVFALTFQQSDISLTTVDNGEDAVRLAGEISPDLVVADVTLGDRDGFEVATALRGSEATRSCPILILAGSLPPFDEEKFRQCGADAVLFKPFESQELLDKVDMLLRGGEVPVDVAAEEAGAGTGETWDFSDVLDEVEEEAGMTAPAAVTLLPEGDGSAVRGEEAHSLGEFDVSLEEIAREAEGAESMFPEEAPQAEEPRIPEAPDEGLPDVGAEVIAEEPHRVDLPAEDLVFEEEFSDGFDRTPVMDAEREAEEAMVETETGRVGEPPAESVFAVEAPLESMPEPVPEPAPLVPPEPSVAESTGMPEAPVAREEHDLGGDGTPAEGPPPGDLRIREEFSDRVREILEKVAAETVEKVMWEMMERLSGEITQQIREAVEAVAWDVIPATAESLIREEIERIRGKTGK